MIRKHIAALIGRRLFQRAIRGVIPNYVSDIYAVEYPIPFIRSEIMPLVKFSYCEPFERDVLVTGWEDFTNSGGRGSCSVHGTRNRCETKSHLYTVVAWHA
jgi:hypothetical protein